MADENYRRKLTAILSADVAGYSRVMGDDEVRNLLKIYAVLNTPPKKLDEMTKREANEGRETHKKGGTIQKCVVFDDI